MSESTQNNTERNPFTKPGFVISAALVIALIAAVIVIFLLLQRFWRNGLGTGALK